MGDVLAPWGIYEFFKLVKEVRATVTFTTDYMRSGRAVTNDGAPGVGKTFTGSNTAYNLALDAWELLKDEYYTQTAMLPQWLKDGE